MPQSDERDLNKRKIKTQRHMYYDYVHILHVLYSMDINSIDADVHRKLNRTLVANTTYYKVVFGSKVLEAGLPTF